MNRRKWIWAVVLAVPGLVGGGLAYAGTQGASNYTCPLTGEALRCSECCPLNQKPAAAEEGYTCPITGETLGCPNCCPLNK